MAMDHASVDMRENGGQSQSVEYTPDGCRADVGKGQKIIPESGSIVLDTGDNRGVSIPEGEAVLSEAELGLIYRQTIAGGIVDHHYIDSAIRGRTPEGWQGKCTTQIVADHADDILNYIKANKVTTSVAHYDGDEDSVASSYLTQSLIQKGRLPIIAHDLAAFVNKVDYGRFEEKDPEKYGNSFAGVFGAIKAYLETARDNSLGKNVFGNAAMKDPSTNRLNGEGFAKMNEIKADCEKDVVKYTFELLNACEEAKKQNPSFDIITDMPAVEKDLSPELQVILNGEGDQKGGKEMVRDSFTEFAKDFENAQKITVKMRNQLTGEEAEFPMVISLEPKVSPLAFTNMAYRRTPPETIIAVYGGKDRKGGDMYDIGITPDSAKLIDLGALVVALNKAEKAKREMSSDTELQAKWSATPDRLGMSGAEQVLTKDPTVLVAGGSLIAASNTSLLTPEDFLNVMRRFQAGK